jgi:hypothetical protein
MAAFEVLSLDPAVPQIRAPGAGDTYSVPREMAISVDTATDALRITQTGAGNALVVEDSANPDASPFVVNASGNVGVGVTPSAWRSTYNALNIGFNGAICSRTTIGQINISSNFYQNAAAADTYITNGFASLYQQTSGTHLFFVAPSGTAETSIPFVQAMTLNSSGNLGIGTTAPATALNIGGTTNNTFQGTASITGTTLDVTAVASGTLAIGDRIYGTGIDFNTVITALGTGTGGTGTYTLSNSQTFSSGNIWAAPANINTLRFTDTDTTERDGQPLGGIEFFNSDASTPGAGVKGYLSVICESSSPDTAMVFGTSDNVASTQALERMRINSSGNVGIGTAAPQGKLNVVKGTASGTTASTSANNIVIDGTSGTETGMTLFSTAGSSIRFGDASGSDQGLIEYVHATDYMRFATNAVERMRLTSAGELLVGGTTAINSSSGFISCEKLNGQSGIALFRNDTSISTGNVFGSVDFYGNDTTANAVTLHAGMSAVASGDHAAGDNPTDILFNTTPDGTATAAEAGRITQAGSYVLKGGTTTAAAGVGIIFPATQVASANANSLDDYEEGTWTVAFPSGTGTFTSQSARYTKIGRQVFAEWDFTVNTIGTSSASQFSGLPFTQGGSISGGTIAFWSSAANGIIGVGGCYASTTLIYLTGSTTSQTTATDWNAMGNGTRITGAITYTV